MTDVEEKAQVLKKSLWEFWAKRIQDVLLIGSATTYILGYIVWSFYAAQNNLGAITPLDTQYFVAGVVPSIIVCISIFSYFLFLNIAGTVKRNIYAKYDDTDISKARKSALSLTFFAIVVILGNTYSYRLLMGKDKSFWVGSIYVFIMTFAGFLIDAKETKLFRFFRGLQTLILILPISYVAINFYFHAAYKNLPQEFGGVKPRCSYLDIYRSSMSWETLEIIAPKNTNVTDQEVIQTKELEILFPSREEIIIRVDGEILNISKSAIQVIRTCP